MHALTSFVRSLFRPVRFPSLATTASGCVSLLCLALFAQPALAQTLDVTGGPYTDQNNPPFLNIFNIQLSGTGNVIDQIKGSENHEWSCGNGNPSTGGYIFYTLNSVEQPCANSTAYSLSGTVIVGNCKGPAQIDESFDDGSKVTFQLTIGGRFCRSSVISGTFTPPGTQADGGILPLCPPSLCNVKCKCDKAKEDVAMKEPLIYRCGSDRQSCFHKVVFAHRGPLEF